jgi:hypothetical protein
METTSRIKVLVSLSQSWSHPPAPGNCRRAIPGFLGANRIAGHVVFFVRPR